MKKEDLPANLAARFDHACATLSLCSAALTELQIITDRTYDKKELAIVNTHTFDFYRVTLQYCFVMEYSKLLEFKNLKDLNKRKNEHISSLFRLNESLNTYYQNVFTSHLSNNLKLSGITATDFYDKIRMLRDKKFGHSDKHEVNPPFRISGLNAEQIREGFQHLRILKEALDGCCSIYDGNFQIKIPSNDNRTENFIRFQAKCQEHFMKNFVSARAEKSDNKRS